MIMENQLQEQAFEPAAKVLAATAISQTLSFCMERKYLETLSMYSSTDFRLDANAGNDLLDASWLKINQIGKPIDNSAENCFTAVQKILHSCHWPKETQLLFLVTGDGERNHMYLGIRQSHLGTGNVKPKTQIKYLNDFIKGVWPGLNAVVVQEGDEALLKLQEEIQNDKIEYVHAITGIPSMESQYKSIYPATVDMLMAGMNKSRKYAYFVVADPLPSDDVEQMLFQCRNMGGQVESLKSINVQESFSKGTSMNHTVSRNITETINNTISESVSKKSFSGIGKGAMTLTGLGMAASVMPAAGEILSGVADVGTSVASAALGLVGFGGIGNAIVNMQPSVTKGRSYSEGRSIVDGESDSTGTSENYSQCVSRNLVNKHVNAVTEHLDCLSKRFETGKAIGMWKVGVYLMANKSSDILNGSMQLKSILSGQESVFEPVRSHDISEIADGDVKTKSLGHFSAPSIAIKSPNGNTFNHPLGVHYTDLKSVLTTKELSYLINFPLHSVPGISVIDSSPEFSLSIEGKSDADSIDFGRLLYGGSITDMAYTLPAGILSKHTLLSGINGTGKTNTVQAILNSISERIPYLIIEPAKTEYVDWAIEYNKANASRPISIYMPGCKSYKDKKTLKDVPLKDLRINPFELVWLDPKQDPNVLAHIDRLKSTFAAAFPMYDILPVLMEDLIYTVYQNRSTDWLSKEPVWGEMKSPTLNSMSVSVDKVIDNRGYESRIQQNMKACLNTRIDSLKRGWKGEMLNVQKSTSWEELFERPVVINLSYVGDDVDKGFFMSLILQFLYEYLTAKAECGKVNFNSNECHHFTVIEEAHRVMMKCDNPEMPQYRTAMMFSNMLSEIRAYGEGMMLVDQVPTRLIPDAIKNTNTKITHRLVAEDDVKAVSESMGISMDQRKIIPKLLVGQCLVSTSLTTDKHWVQVNKVK